MSQDSALAQVGEFEELTATRDRLRKKVLSLRFQFWPRAVLGVLAAFSAAGQNPRHDDYFGMVVFGGAVAIIFVMYALSDKAQLVRKKEELQEVERRLDGLMRAGVFNKHQYPRL